MYLFLIGLDPRDRLAHQQKLLRKRLGLDMVPGLDVGMDQLFDDSDLLLRDPEKKTMQKQKSFEVPYVPWSLLKLIGVLECHVQQPHVTSISTSLEYQLLEGSA